MLGAFAITIAGWFAWQGFLDGAYARKPSPYAARGGFSHTFGPDGLWWLTALAIVAALIVIETAYKAVKHRLVVAGLWRFPPWRRKVRDGRNGVDDDDDDDDGNAEDWDLELWQELERDPAVRQRLRETLEEEERGYTNTRTAPEDEHPPAAEDEGAGLGFFGRVV